MPQQFRAKCREYAAEQIDGQRRDFQRLGVLGDWENPYRTMDFRFEADMLRALAKIVERGHLARGVKPVHWCFDCGSALAEAEIEYADKTSPAVDVAYAASASAGAGRDCSASQLADGVDVAIPIWTTTPWTLPASLAVTLGPGTRIRAGRRPARATAGGSVLVLAEALAEQALAALWRRTTLVVLGRAQGVELEGQQLQHPFYARDHPGHPRRPRHHR